MAGKALDRLSQYKNQLKAASQGDNVPDVPIPPFSALPLRKGDPPHSAWGLYGPNDQLGTLNRLTDSIVARAAKEEIQTGVRISLNWPLDAQKQPSFGRPPFQHDIIHKKPRVVNDDVWRLNSQSSTQWDGLRHYAYQESGKFYNGVTLEDIHGARRSDVNGIHAWEAKGIVGRGVLLDFDAWRKNEGVQYDPLAGNGITVPQLKQVAESQGTRIQFGDILFIRSGYITRFNELSEDARAEHSKQIPPIYSGVGPGEETLGWIWSNFAAVAGDAPALERLAPPFELQLHENLLAGWGMPIGELFCLERLAEICKKAGRWSFFLTSEVCNVPGGVASPANALAIL